MRQELLAYGYKPLELMQITALDVLDFKLGLYARLDQEVNILYTAAEIAAKTKARVSGSQQEKYSPHVRKMIEEADKRDRLAGKLKPGVNG